jgi:hypothetical protein
VRELTRKGITYTGNGKSPNSPLFLHFLAAKKESAPWGSIMELAIDS